MLLPPLFVGAPRTEGYDVCPVPTSCCSGVGVESSTFDHDCLCSHAPSGSGLPQTASTTGASLDLLQRKAWLVQSRGPDPQPGGGHRAQGYIVAISGVFFGVLLLYVVLTGPAFAGMWEQLSSKASKANSAKRKATPGASQEARIFLLAILIVASLVAVGLGRWMAIGVSTSLLAPPYASIVLCCMWYCPVLLHWLQERLDPIAWKVGCGAPQLTDQKALAPPKTQAASAAQPPANASNETDTALLLASLEHSLPHKGVHTVAGGLGKVMSLIARKHPVPITLVHPVLADSGYGLENDERLDPLELVVDGKPTQVQVFQSSMTVDVSEGSKVTMTFLLLLHPWFMKRPWKGIYPTTMTGKEELMFFSLWNQAVGALLVRNKTAVFHCPDFHSTLAPLHALQEHPHLRTLLVLHNASYQGLIKTDMVEGDRLMRLSKILNLPAGIVQTYCLHDGRFNMLKAGVEVIRRLQSGTGLCAVSTAYAREARHEHAFLRGVDIVGIDNCMEDLPEIQEAIDAAGSLDAARLHAKAQVQKLFNLSLDPDAKLLVYLGRMVKQKGMDLLAELAPRILQAFPEVQLLCLGPVGDAHGVYAKGKLEALEKSPQYQGRVHASCKYVDVPPSVYLAADFCVVPSRDEPFGYVDVEFAWRGALCIGAAVGGLGKVPGFYYKVTDKDNDLQLQDGIWQAVCSALRCDEDDLEVMRQRAREIGFPVHRWQAKIKQELSRQMLAAYALDPEKLLAPPVKHRWGERFVVPKTAEEKLEVFRPEVSIDDLGDGVERALALDPDADLQDVIDDISAAHDVDMESNPFSKALLQPVRMFGMRRARWIHLVIGMAYITAPVVDMAVVMFVQQWIALTAPEQATEAKLMLAELRAAAFIMHSLGASVGSAVWSMMCKLVPPRTLLITVLCLEPPLLLFMYVSAASELSLQSDGRSCLLTAMCLHGALSSSAVLFVVFNFMMTVTELREITVITSALDSARVLVTLLISVYIFSVSTDSFQSSTVVVAPLVFFVMGRTLLAWPLLYAPRAYREERMPNLGLRLSELLQSLWQHRAYVLLVLMDCVGQVAAFPSLLCVVWFSMGGWSMETYVRALIAAALIIGPAVALWGWAQWFTAGRGGSFIFGAALHLPPVTPLLALVLQQASDGHGGHARGFYAILLCVAVFALKSMRTSSLGVLRIQLVRTQWHFVAVRTMEACFTNFFRAASPFACSMILYYMVRIEEELSHDPTTERRLHVWSFEANSQLELANAISVTTLPLAVLEILLQLMASQSVKQELNLPSPPPAHPRNRLVGMGRYVPALVTAGLFWACMGAAHAKIAGPLNFIQI